MPTHFMASSPTHFMAGVAQHAAMAILTVPWKNPIIRQWCLFNTAWIHWTAAGHDRWIGESMDTTHKLTNDIPRTFTWIADGVSLNDIHHFLSTISLLFLVLSIRTSRGPLSRYTMSTVISTECNIHENLSEGPKSVIVCINLNKRRCLSSFYILENDGLVKGRGSI